MSAGRVRLAVVLALSAVGAVACGGKEREAAATPQSASRLGYAGPQALVLRVPRAGGMPRVFAYPRLDSLVWTSTTAAPAPTRVLAFADESGTVAYEDTRGRPVTLELRLGSVTVASTRKLTELASADASAIFGIASNGDVVRVGPSGDWTYKPPRPARTVFPQRDGAALVESGSGEQSRLLKLFPPEPRILDSIRIPAAARAVRTQLGDRLYLAVDSGLVVLRTRTMDWAPNVSFKQPITVMASTPSGDRMFVLTDSGKSISVVDRYRARVARTFPLPGRAEDLRVDPFGRYLLARAAQGDSIWVVAIGTQRVIGGVSAVWRTDLPFVGYDGSVVVASGDDVRIYDGETLKPRSRVRGGARDYWYPLMWDGFRPRAATLDEPVRFDSVIMDTVAFDSTAVDSLAARDSVPAAADSIAPKGFFVSFAAFLARDRARELASQIRVADRTAHVMTSVKDGSAIYRVVLGPYGSRDEADRAGRASGHSYWVYEGLP